MEKTIFSFFTLGLLFSLSSHADLVLVHESGDEGMKGELTTKIKGDKMRTDVGSMHSVIADLSSGETVTLVPPNMAFRIQGPALEKVKSATAGSALVELVPTGKTEKVRDIDTEIYTASSGMMTGTFWIAKNYPNGAKIVAVLNKIQQSPAKKIEAATVLEPKSYPGVPIKTVLELGGNADSRVYSTLVSAKEEEVAASQFEIPADFKVTEVNEADLKPSPKRS